MKTFRELSYLFLEYLKALILPICLLILVTLLLARITNLADTQTYNTVFGIALGVFLGFLADLTKRTLDSLQSKHLLRKVSLKLLEDDARKIYHLMWLLDRALQDKSVIVPIWQRL